MFWKQRTCWSSGREAEEALCAAVLAQGYVWYTISDSVLAQGYVWYAISDSVLAQGYVWYAISECACSGRLQALSLRLWALMLQFGVLSFPASNIQWRPVVEGPDAAGPSA